MTDIPLPEAGQRGRLEIADRVIDRIAGHAAMSVPGVVETGSTIGKIVGRRLPRVSSRVHGSGANVSMDIAVAWPHSLGTVAREVRKTVGSQLTSLAGMSTLVVDVYVAKVEPPTVAPIRRVE